MSGSQSEVDNALNELSAALQKYHVLDSLPEVKAAYFRYLSALAGAKGEHFEQKYWEMRLKSIGAEPKKHEARKVQVDNEQI